MYYFKIILFTLLLSPILTFGQLKTENSSKTKSKGKFDKSKLRYGGNMGFYLGTSTFIEINPTVGYQFTDKFQAGIGSQYFYQRRVFSNTTFNGHSYGSLLFERINITSKIFQHGEFSLMNYKGGNHTNGVLINTFRVTVPALNLGLGYSSYPGRGAFVLVLYDVLFDIMLSRNSSPWSIRFGFNF